MAVRTLSVSSSKLKFSKYKYRSRVFVGSMNHASDRSFFVLIEYISRENQDIPMDFHSATDRNAQTLFLTEMLRGILLSSSIITGVT